MSREYQSVQADNSVASNVLMFMGEFFRTPLALSSMFPSSRSLAALMTSELQDSSGPVIELGSGTGPITRALVDRGVPESRMALVELNERFCDHLRAAYPEARVLNGSAEQIADVDFGFGEPPVAVLSGVPMLSLPPDVRVAILAAAFSVLAEGGVLYQLSFSFVCPISNEILDGLGLQASRLGTVFTNIPPASVYRIERKPA